VTRVVFEVVELKGQKQGTCSACGRRRQRTERFSQTVNPFNKNKAGQVKSREEIYEEVHAEWLAWMEKPFRCRECD
jgi:hypothetical protein